MDEINQLKHDFDEALFRLRHDKVQLDIDMKTADLRLLTQFEELQLLKEFEKKETIFTSRYKSRKQDKQDMESKVIQAPIYIYTVLSRGVQTHVHIYM